MPRRAADYDGAAFPSQQAAEKAIQALFLAQGGEPWGHLLTGLLDGLPSTVAADSEVRTRASRLDKHYIPAPYPNGFAAGFPAWLYTRGEAEEAIADAETRSSISAGATYLDRNDRIRRLREAARRAAERIPSIERVILFGSLVAGISTPRSDAHLPVILASSSHPNPRGRVPDLLRALSPLPCPVDHFVLTREEIERSGSEGSPVVRIAMSEGMDLLSEATAGE